MRRVPRRILIVGAAFAALFVGSATVYAGEAEDLRDQAGQLENELGSLEASANATVLELFALESELARASRRLETLTAKATRVESATDSAREQTQIARQALGVAEEGLAERVRALYMTGDVDSLEVLLGATSIQTAVDGIGALRRTISRDDEIVTQVSAARSAAIEQRDDLRVRQDRVEQAVADAEAARQGLDQTRADRRVFLASLRDEVNLGQRDIEELRQRAAALETRAAEIQAQAATQASAGSSADPSGAATSPSPAPGDTGTAPTPQTPPPAPVSPSATPPSPPPTIEIDGGGALAGSQLTVVATGYALTGTTAVGVQTQYGIIAVDPRVIPLGTKMSVPGYGDGVAADTGSAVNGAIIDLWFPTVQEALNWGRRTVTITFR
jgi:3D (Asp-Asp-Asp) domain-containing protein/peptidoglycan hydrolase CwlO-like protein